MRFWDWAKIMTGGALLAAFFWSLPPVSWVQAQSSEPGIIIDIEAQETSETSEEVDSSYRSIMTYGIIFANICDGVNDSEPGDRCYECRGQGKCSLNDALQVFVNIMAFILGIIGSLILLMFFWGGFMWVTSYGHPDKVEKGKQTMSSAIIGLAIVLGSYVFLNFVLATVTGSDLAEDNVQEQFDNTQ